MEHWLKEEPVQDAQSGWQVRQERPPEGEKVPEGQVETHWPLEASWEEDEQVRQKLDAPIHVPQEESHAIEMNVNLNVVKRRGDTYLYRSSYLAERQTCQKDNSQDMLPGIERIQAGIPYTAADSQWMRR